MSEEKDEPTFEVRSVPVLVGAANVAVTVLGDVLVVRKVTPDPQPDWPDKSDHPGVIVLVVTKEAARALIRSLQEALS